MAELEALTVADVPVGEQPEPKLKQKKRAHGSKRKKKAPTGKAVNKLKKPDDAAAWAEPTAPDVSRDKEV